MHFGVNKHELKKQIARARAFKKFSSAYHTKLQEKSRSLNEKINLNEKTSQKGKTDEIWKPCALLVMFSRVTTLHSYMRMHSFSANQKRVIFPIMLLSNKRSVFVRPLKSAFKLTNKHDFISLQLE